MQFDISIKGFEFMNVLKHQNELTLYKLNCFLNIYRNGAINSRSWKVAAPLTFQAKTHFLCVFYEVI